MSKGMEFYLKVKKRPDLMQYFDTVLTSKAKRVKKTLNKMVEIIQNPDRFVITSLSDVENYKTFIQLFSEFGRRRSLKDYARSCLEKLSDERKTGTPLGMRLGCARF